MRNMAVLTFLTLITYYQGWSQPKRYQTLGNKNARVIDLLLSPDGKTVVSLNSTDTIASFSTERYSKVAAFFLENATASLDVSPSGSKISCGSGDGFVYVFENPGLRLMRKIPIGAGESILKTKWHGDENLLVATNTGVIYLKDTLPAAIRYSFSVDVAKVASLEVLLETDKFEIALSNGEVQRRYANDGRLITTAKISRSSIKEIKPIPSKDLTAYLSENRKISLRNSKDFSEVDVTIRQLSWITSLDVTNNAFSWGSKFGFVRMSTPFAYYQLNLKAIPTKVIFFPAATSRQMTLAIATLGRGIIILQAGQMNSKEPRN